MAQAKKSGIQRWFAGRRGILSAIAALLVVALLVGLLISLRGRLANGTISNGCPTGSERVKVFQTLPASMGSAALLPGPNCSLFVETGGRIWRITTDGKLAPFANPGTSDLIEAPDGSLWTDSLQAFIQINPHTGAEKHYPTPWAFQKTFSVTLAVDRNGAIWFGGQIRQNVLWRFDPATGKTQGFSIPRLEHTQNLVPVSLITAPDGSVWCLLAIFNTIKNQGEWLARIDPQTYAIAVHPLPLRAFGRQVDWVNPGRLTVGPDGMVWFLSEMGAIGHMTSQGKVIVYPLPRGYNANDMTTGSDGALWIACWKYPRGSLLRVTPAGVVTAYSWFPPLPKGSSSGQPGTIATGPDGRLWVLYEVESLNGFHVGGRASGGPPATIIMRITLSGNPLPATPTATPFVTDIPGATPTPTAGG